MSYELYWHGPLDAYFIYADKTRQENERKQEEMNNSAWLSGLYVHKALVSVYHMFNPLTKSGAKTFPYPKEPIKSKPCLTPEQERKRDEIAEMIREHNLLVQVQMEGGDTLGGCDNRQTSN